MQRLAVGLWVTAWAAVAAAQPARTLTVVCESHGGPRPERADELMAATREGLALPGLVIGRELDALVTERFSYPAGRADHPLLGLVREQVDLYVSDYGTIRRITIGSPWTVATILGAPGLLDGVDGIGSAARLGAHMGLVIVGTNLYVSDPITASLRVVDLSVQPYSITTVAGVLNARGTDDGVGAAARLNAPWAVAWDGTSLFVADVPRVRQVNPTTMRVTTLVGRSDCTAAIDGDHTQAAFNVATSLVYSEATGYLYVTDSDTIREIR